MISHVLYKKIVIPDPFREVLPRVIYLEEDISAIDEIIISAKINRKKRREKVLIVIRHTMISL